MVENGVAFPTGAKPHFGRAIHTGSLLPPPPSPPFGKDIIPLGRGLGRWSVATGMESDQGEGGGGRRRGDEEGGRECKKVVARAFAAFYKLFN